MPFQSEKQRRYLWANEPEIARDWTNTYGSRIQKNEGGLTSIRQGYFSGGDIIKMGLKQIAMSQAKKKAQEYGYFPEPTQKKGMGSFLGKMLATLFLGPAAGLAWDIGSGIMSKKGSSFAPNFNMPNFSGPTTAQQQATQQFMQNYNVGINPQTGRMTSGPFAGKNAPGTSMFGSKTPKEMAQKWVAKYGDMQYKTKAQQQKQQLMKNIATMNQGPAGIIPTAPKPKPTITYVNPGRPHGNGGGNGGGGGGQAAADAAGGSSMSSPFNRGGLAALWPR